MITIGLFPTDSEFYPKWFDTCCGRHCLVTAICAVCCDSARAGAVAIDIIDL